MSAGTEQLLNTHEARVDFGKYNGERITRLPQGYLRWAITNGVEKTVRLADGSEVPFAEVARAEMDRRGERVGAIDVTGHAVDRFSQKHLKVWKRYRRHDEGLYAFIERISITALKKLDSVDRDDVELRWRRVRLVFDLRYHIPILITVK